MIRYAAVIAALLAAGPAFAVGGAEQVPGTQFHYSPAELPKPYATPGVANQSAVVARPPGAKLHLLPGFEASLFAEGLEGPRNLLVLPDGDVLAAESKAGKIVLLQAGANGLAGKAVTYASGFTRPFGMALHDGALYVADVTGVYRLGFTPGEQSAGVRQPVTKPGALDGWDDHWTRNIAFGRDGTLFLAEGSTQNVGIDPLPHAAISIVNKDGSLTPFATGLRNPVGLHFYPGTDDLYTAVNERDMLGNGLAPDYFTRVEKGAFYGWPYAYNGPHPDPNFGAKAPEMVAKTRPGDVLLQAHSAPLGFIVYEGEQFPAEYKGDVFLALHGSWNSATPTGYKIVRVRFKDGRPEGGYENFITGWWVSGDERAEVMGRPAGLAVTKDGSLLIADDAGNAIWRVRYTGKK